MISDYVIELYRNTYFYTFIFRFFLLIMYYFYTNNSNKYIFNISFSYLVEQLLLSIIILRHLFEMNNAFVMSNVDNIHDFILFNCTTKFILFEYIITLFINIFILFLMRHCEYHFLLFIIGTTILHNFIFVIIMYKILSYPVVHSELSLTENLITNKLDEIIINDTKDYDCKVCLENIENGSIIYDLKCNHKIHKECLDNWLNLNKNTCPICKIKL